MKLSFKSSFEKALYSTNYRLYWDGKEDLPTFTTSDARGYLDTFLKFYKENYKDVMLFGIIKINKNSIFVGKDFKMHLFINEMLSLFDKVKCYSDAIHGDEDNEFMISPFI